MTETRQFVPMMHGLLGTGPVHDSGGGHGYQNSSLPAGDGGVPGDDVNWAELIRCEGGGPGECVLVSDLDRVLARL